MSACRLRLFLYLCGFSYSVSMCLLSQILPVFGGFYSSEDAVVSLGILEISSNLIKFTRTNKSNERKIACVVRCLKRNV